MNAVTKAVRPFLKTDDGPRVTDGEMILFIVCVLITTVGLAGDIARHLQNPGDLKGDFLSGWHLVLYGGVASVGGCIGLGALRRGPSYVGSVGSGTIGFLLLGVGGFTDAVWHAVFGTEAKAEALVSPPHLLVFAGLGFLLTAPIVVVWERPTRRLGWVPSIAVGVAVVSMILVTSLFTGYLSPLSGGLSLQASYIEPLVGESVEDYDVVRGLGIIVWTAAVLAAAHAVVLMRFRLKPGIVFVGFAVLATPPVFISQGQSIRALCWGFVAAGLTAELCVLALGRPVLGRIGACVTVAAMNAALWSTTFALLHERDRLAWGTHLWTGVICISALVAAATAGLVGLRVPTGDEVEGVTGVDGDRPTVGVGGTARG